MMIEKEVAKAFADKGISAYYVGGCVRDALLGNEVEDIDICLEGVKDKSIVTEILDRHYDSIAPEVGKFPVWIVKKGDIVHEYALTRTEKLIGAKRTDFEVVTDEVTIEEDLCRRDLTINAVARRILNDELIDPYNGIGHMKSRTAQPVGEAFKEDTLRVIRAARFISRFDLTPSDKLIRVCSALKPTDITPERVGMELKKMMKQATRPSQFFRFLNVVGWLEYYFKELSDLQGIEQDADHHPEGDAYQHTLHTIDQATDWFIRTVMLCHDLGKSTTTTYHLVKKKWQAIGHEIESERMTKEMLKRIVFDNKKTINQIATLVSLHMVRIHINEGVIRRTLRTLMQKGLSYSQLVEVCRCDVSGRPPRPGYTPDIGLTRAQELLNSGAMVPIVTGERLIAAGFTPDKRMGKLISKGLEWQDRGTLNEENWLRMIKQYRDD